MQYSRRHCLHRIAKFYHKFPPLGISLAELLFGEWVAVVSEVVPKVWIKLLGPLYGLYQPLLFASSLEQCLNSAGYNRHICCRLKASDYITLAVDKELCEIPLNIRLRCVVGVCLREYLIKDGR